MKKRKSVPSKRTILVSGDVAVDWLNLSKPSAGSRAAQNWRSYPKVQRVALPGGALLLAELMRSASDAQVLAPELEIDLGGLNPEQMVCSNVRIEPLGQVKGSYSISEYEGFAGPECGEPRCYDQKSGLVSFPVDAGAADLVLIDDAGNEFRDHPKLWPKRIGNNALLLIKMYRPFGSGRQWELAERVDADRLVVVMGANDLRRMKEVNISKSISWERTAMDLVWQITRNPALETLKRCRNLVVLFGSDGAIHYRGDTREATLFFDPLMLEGQYESSLPGEMMGLGSAFMATLASEILEKGIGSMGKGIVAGLQSMRVLLSTGFLQDGDSICYPCNDLFGKTGLRQKHPFARVRIPAPSCLDNPDPTFWRILEQKTRNTRELVAANIIQHGLGRGLDNVPIGVFGNLRTIDRKELEAYSGIRNLISDFLRDHKAPKPLSIAVFGAPGSGKSFGVSEVASSICGDAVEKLEFNISQFRGLHDLISAFHQVRNVVLTGKVPFVFFDEFDSKFEGETLGGLKYFLAPMQDGKFRDGETDHPIGKAIFVFAGGTSHSFEMFARNDADHKEIDAFKNAKGPDFVSRLRGFINIMGTNPVDSLDQAFIIRRAMMLRVIFQLSKKAKTLFSTDKCLNIDEGLIRAFLNVPRYKHGTRSMAAILDMSTLVNQNTFSQAALPPREQLDLHVDADAFMFLAEKARFTNNRKEEKVLIDKIARDLHNNACRNRTILAIKSTETQADFSHLRSDLRNSYINQAEDIPNKLKAIRCSVRRIDRAMSPRTPDITESEVLSLARMEHERYCRERFLQGWTHMTGIENPELRTSPYLVPYAELPAVRKREYQEAIWALPMILLKNGLEVYRLQEYEEVGDPKLIDIMARTIHLAYCENRKKEGDTPESNPAMKPFDQLSEDLRQANIDNAAAIPVKLRSIGCRIRKAEDGAVPSWSSFSKEEVEVMARVEHDRWNWQKRLQGWVYKKGRKDQENKTTPYLVEWKKLPEEIKEYDREPVRLIPELLAKAGYEIVKE